MSVWLDSSGNSNKFKQSYFRDFVDVSGEVLIRNGLSLKLYNNNVPTRVQFSINSNEFRVYNDTDHTYYDISNTKLIYLQDLSENVQAKLSQVNTFQSALSLKANTSVVDASFASVNSLIATKASTSVVDASFALVNSAIATKAGLASPDLTGVPTAPTASAGTNTTQIATTAFVKSAVDTIIASAPAALDTLNELAAALGNDASFSSTVTNTLASKAPLANPTFTGTVNASKVAISSDASFNGRVDVCGNFYAKYPASSIPASAIIGGEYTIDISSNQTISGIKTFTNGLVIGEAEFNVINQTQTTSTQSGVVTINPTSTWSQTGGDFNGVATSNRTGSAVAINSEGNIIAVASAATSGFGYVKVYTRAVNKTSADSYGPIGWNQIGQTINSTLATGAFGEGMALNSDGYVLAIGHALSANNNGVTYVYSYNTATNTWIQRGDTIVGEGVNNYSGRGLSLSADGTIIAIDAYGNSDGLSNRGHVRVYKYDANKTVANTNQSSSTFGPVGWNRLGQDIDGESAGDWSGFYTALSSDGTIVAIGAYAANNTRGQVRVYKYDVNKTTANTDQSSPTYGPVGWNRLGEDIDGEPSTANYAGVVSLNSDGTIVAIGGYITNTNTGHVRVYKYDVNKTVANTNQSSSTFGPVGWNRLGQDIRGTAVNQNFGNSVSLNSLGNILAVGMPGANGNGVRVYLYDINKTTEDLNTSSSTFGPVGWNRIGQDLTGPSGSNAGLSTRLNSVGNIVVFGAPVYNSSTGRAFVYSVPTTSSSSSVTTVVGSSIQINSAVDICGNFYAQYPSNSIPASAVNGISTTIQTALDLKATKTIVDASFTSVNSAIALKADLASPSLTGVPTAPTATVGTNTTQLATTAFVKSAVDNLVASAPAALDTLNELAAALGNDANYAATVTNTLSQKANSTDVDNALALKTNITYVDASLNIKPSFSQVDASLNLKSNITYVDASLNVKPSFSQVDASLNLKSNITYVDASLNVKPSFSQVDASLNLKSNITYVDASLNLKSDVTYVDASLNAKPSFSQVDTSLNLKANLVSPTFTGTPNAPTASYDNSSNQLATTGFVQGRISSIINSAPAALDTLNELAAALGNDANYAATVTNLLSQKANSADVNTALALKATTTFVDASLNLKSDVTYVDASLNAKPSFSLVDASLNLKSNITYVDASLNVKPTFSQVDASLNLKSDTIYVDASLNLKANLVSPTFTGSPSAPTASYDNSSNQLATTGFVQGRISSIINGAPAALDTLYELAAALGNDANYASTVTNALSQKANTADVNAELALKATTSSVDASLNLKSNLTYVDASLNAKPSFSQVDASLNLKSNLTYVDAALTAKPSFSQVDASLNTKPSFSQVDASLNTKPSFSQVDASLNVKSDITYVDASLNLKSSIAYVDASLNLKSNVVSPTFTGTPNAPTASYDNSSNQIATTGFVQGRINSIINSAPAALDTLNELAAALGNDANYAATVTNTLSQKANTTDVNSALALKATIASVDASLNLKPNVTYVDASLNAKPSFSQVDASLNLKSDLTSVDASLNLKANLVSPIFTGTPNAPTAAYDNSSNQLATTGFVQGRISSIINSAPAALDTLNELAAALGNDANYAATITNSLSQKANTTDVNSELALKPNFSQVDASLNLKSAVTYVDASLNAKPSFTQVDVSLNSKPSFSQVDASLNLKSAVTYVDASLNAKPSFSQVDASLNLKSAVTYVDASLNAKPSFSQVDASLNLKSAVTYVDASLNAKPSFSQVDISLNIKPSFSQVDASLNSKSDIIYVDASLNLKATLASPMFTGTPNAPTASYDNSSNQIATTGFVQGRISSIINSAPAALDTLNELAAALGNDANYAATVTNSLSQKANTTDVNTALALKATISSVDASLNLKSNVTYVDASLNTKPSFSQVDVSLNAKPSFSQVDVSLNAKPSFSQVDASLNLKSDRTYVDDSLNAKPSFSQVDVSLNAKPSFSQVDASLNAKPSFSQVDASLNLKASSASPTFTGTLTAPKLISGDASFNGNIDISGVLSVTQTVNSVVKNTTINNYNVSVTNDLSLNGKLIVSSDVSLNSKLYVKGDASFNGRVDICGNFYANYPNNSIPSSAISNGVTLSYVDASLNLKPSFAQVDASLNAMINSSQVDASLNLKSNVTYVDASLNLKPSFSQVDTSLNLKSAVTYVDASLNLKPSFSQVDTSLNLKSAVTYVDASLNLKANLASPTFTGTPNAPTAAYDSSSNQIATTGFVQGRISAIINSAPAALDTLNELAVALGNDANYAATVTNLLSQKANITDVNSAVALKPSFSQVDASLNLKPSFAQVDASLNAIINSSQIDASLNLKPNFSQVDASLNLKPSFSQVDASLNLKPSFSQVDASLNLKPSFSQVDASLNLKSAVTYVDASLNLKADIASPTFTGTPNAPTASYDNSSNQIATTGFVQGRISAIINSAPAALDTLNELAAALGNDANYAATVTNLLSQKANITDVNSAVALKPTFSQVDISLNMKPSFSQVDASLNLKASVTYVDASLNLKPSFSQVDASLNLKPTFAQVDASLNAIINMSQVDASLNLKPSFSQVDASLNLKSDVTYVDASLNLKAAIASPTFTGIPNAPTASYDNSSNQIATTGFVQGRISSIINSAPAALDTLNELAAALGNDANYAATITNSLSQKANTTDVNSALALKPSFAQVDASLNMKPSFSQIDASLNLKPTFAQVDASLNLKPTFAQVDASLNAIVNMSQVDASLNMKPSFVQVDASLNLKPNFSQVDASLNLKPSFSQVDASLNLKSDRTYVDLSLNSKASLSQVDASLNLKANLASPTFTGVVTASKLTSGDASFNGNIDISGVLSVTQTVNSVVKNTTINNYNVAVTNDLSLNGKLIVSSDVSLNSKLYVKGDASFNGRVDICGNFYANYPANSIPSSAIIGGVSSGSTGSVDISSNQTISGVKTFTNGLNVGPILVSSVTGNPSFQRIQIGQDIDGEAASDQSGYFVSMNSDGTVVAIGAPFNDGTANMAGHVRVYKNINGTWTKLGQDIDGEADSDQSGWSVSLSSDGTIVAIAANRNDGTASNAGHVRVYKYNGSTTWTKLGQDIDGEATNDGWSGYSVSLSSDGTIVAIGSPYNSGSAAQSGSVRVYKYNGSTTWTKLGQDIDGEASGDQSGYSVSISSDGTIVAIGAPYNTSSASGEGQVRVYKYNGSTTWTQIGQDIDGEATSGTSGYSISLSSDGTVVAIGAIDNDGTSGSNSDNRGSVRVYKYNGSTWTKLGQDLDGEASSNQSGRSVSISGDGTIIAIGAPFNTGTNTGAGHVRIYQYSGTTWTQLGTDIDGEAAYDSSGMAVSLSTDGVFVAIGATDNDANGTSSGHVRVYKIRDLTTTKVIVSNNLDICGNLYAQYAAASIPASAINGISSTIQTAIDLKATKTIVDASFTTVNSAIALKANLASPALTGVPTAPTASAGTNTTQLATTEFTTTAVSTKANLASPALTGVPTAPTASAGTNTTQLATTAFVKSAVDNLVASAPAALDTLNELAAALGNDAAFSTTVTNTLASKAPLANPTFTGTINASKVSISSDASFNGRVDICGNFYAKYPASSIPASAIIGGVGGGGSFDPNTDLSLNQKLAVGGDVSLNSNVDIRGNLKIGTQIPFTVDPSGQWSQIGSSINGQSAPEWFGAGDGVDMNADGTIIIVGGNRFSSNTGRAFVYKYINSAWTQLGQTIVGSGTNVYCGAYTAINAAGDIIAVSSTYTDVTYTDSGSVTVYKYNTGSSLWVQLGQTLNGPAINAHFGNEIELNADGYTIVIGNADLNQCFVYRYNGTSTWNQLGNTIAGATGDVIGLTVDINEAGDIVALGTLPTTIKIYSLVGSTWTILGNVITTGAATGRYDKLALSSDGYTVIAGDEANNAALVYKYNGTTWVQRGQKILGPDSIGGFGGDVAINSDGTVVAAGSRMSVSAKGQAFAYWYNGSAWVQLGQTIDGIATGDRCGETVSLSKSGTVFAVGSSLYGGGLGQVRIFSIPYTAAVSSGKLAVNCDTSFNSRVDICGNFYAQYPAASIPASAINGIALKADLASPTFTGNVVASKMRVTSDASFNGRVDICGNFYAQYPASSIPSSAIIGGVGGGGSAFATDICVNSITIGRGGGNSNFSNAVGINALGRNTTGGMNVAVGTNSLFSNLTGENNVAMNFGALYANTSGSDNVAIGKQAITTNQTGSNNVGVGSLAIQGITSSNNTAVGFRSLVYSSTGSSNTAFGYLAGGNNSTGSFNTYIGYGADVPAFGATWSNSTAIGANARITASNQITLGTAAERVFMPGKLTTSGDASFNGRVDISGSLYANYPANSIPQSAIIGGVGGGSSVVDLTTSQTISGTKTFSNQINIGTNSLIPLATLAVAQLGTNLLGPGTSFAGHATALNDAGTIVAVGCSAHSNFRGAVRVYQWSGTTWTQLGNDILSTSDNTQLGNAVSLSANGLILAAGGYAGNLVRVFEYANGAWTKLGADITNIGPQAGTSVSLSADGLTVAIGAPRDYAVGENSGKTRICKYINGTWTQLGQDILGEAMQNYAGCSVALSADGTIVVIGANYNDGAGTNGLIRYMCGQARVYKYANSTWTQLGQDIDGENNYDMSGWGVAISDDGTIVAIGAPYNAPGGHVRVYKYANSTWTQLGQDIDGRSGSGSGNMVALSADGYTVAIGSQYATGLGGQSNQGYAVVYKYNGSTWSMVGSYIEGQAAGDQFGLSLALSADGTILSGGSPYNNSSTGNVRVYKIQTASSKVIVSDGVDICGNLYAKQLQLSSNATFNGRVDISGNLYANSLQLTSSATFNGRVDICGNFYAQYPPNSIPASAIIGGVGSSSGSSGSSTGANVTFTDNFALIKEAVVVDPASILLRQF